MIVCAGDDHAAKSSTLPHQTDHIFKAVMMPVLYPASVQEYLDLGVHGYAMSRYSGCWVAFKCVTDVVESSASVYVDPDRVKVMLPTDIALPADGLNIRWPDPFLVQEERLLHHKLYAALAYCRANNLNRIVIDSPRPRLGIITSGKAYMDVRQALEDLGIDDRLAAEIGIRLFKVGMTWPLESESVRRFAQGLEEILVVEEKRQFLEYQLKEELYNWREDVRPRVIGKFDEKGEWALPHGQWLLPAAGELSPGIVAKAIAARIARFHTSDRIKARLVFLEAKEKALAKPRVTVQRVPYFCSGCPHNTSTRVPEGSRATAGIGCHFMAVWMDRNTATFSHMGGEGVSWIGQAPFTAEGHIFANLGDGTYYHSGLLAIRAAVAAKVPITYKILYNDAVAMTGGQRFDGPLNVPMIVDQVAAEGVERIAIVTDEPEKYRGVTLKAGVPVRHRDDLDQVQRELREYPGVSVLVYDQTCAAEKRRRRKRGTFPDPQQRIFINELVCEGCGDCGVQSNCVSVEPLETEFGRKRTINQSSCNKDYSCTKGFCPSFVTVEGGRVRRGKALADGADDWPALPEPQLPGVDRPYSILVTGIGGTGVITVGALVGMAAHIEGKGVSVLDMTGLAQKNGAVMSHVRLAARPEELYSARIAAGEANAVIGCDMVVAAGAEAQSQDAGRPHAARGQHRGGADRRVHAQARLAVPRRRYARGARGRSRHFERRLRRRDAARDRSPRRRDRDQPVHARLRVPERAGSRLRGCDRAGDRAERGGSRGEPESVPLGPSRRARSCAGREGGDAGGSDSDRAAPLALARRDDRPPRRVPHRLPGRRVRRALPGARRSRARRSRPTAVLARSSPKRWRGNYFKLMAYKDEYEVARLYTRPEFMQRAAGNVRRGLFAQVPPRAADPRQARSGDRRPAQAHVRSVDDVRFQGASEAQGRARHGLRRLRPDRRAAHRASADHGLRANRRGRALQARPRQSPDRGRDRRDPRGDPRLRPREGGEPEAGKGERGGAARGVPVAGAVGSGGVRILRSADYAALPWKNGRGVVRQIAVFPAGAGYETLDWQVSRPTIERDTPFSKLPGLDRQLMLVSGKGLILRARSVEDRADFEQRLDHPLEPFAFRGDWAVDCVLTDGPVEVLNVMTRRGRCGARIEIRELGAPALARKPADETLIVYAADPLTAYGIWGEEGIRPRRFDPDRRAGGHRDRGRRDAPGTRRPDPGRPRMRPPARRKGESRARLARGVVR